MKKFLLFSIFFLPLQLHSQGYGLGIIIGRPLGFSGKYQLAQNAAVVVNAGWSLLHDIHFHATGVYEYQFPGVIKNEEGEPLNNVAPYLGIGGRLLLKARESGDETEIYTGLRLGGGIEYSVSRFGVFFELYPVINVIPSTEFDLEGGLGLRFYL